MKASALSFETRGYRQKALFTKEIGNRPPKAPRSPYMTQITGICPNIWWFWAVLGGFAHIWGVWARYGSSMHAVWVVMNCSLYICALIPLAPLSLQSLLHTWLRALHATYILLPLPYLCIESSCIHDSSLHI